MERPAACNGPGAPCPNSSAPAHLSRTRRQERPIGVLVFYNKRRSGGHGALRAEVNIFSAYGTHAARKAVLQARAPARTPAPA